MTTIPKTMTIMATTAAGVSKSNVHNNRKKKTRHMKAKQQLEVKFNRYFALFSGFLLRKG